MKTLQLTFNISIQPGEYSPSLSQEEYDNTYWLSRVHLQSLRRPSYFTFKSLSNATSYPCNISTAGINGSHKDQISIWQFSKIKYPAQKSKTWNASRICLSSWHWGPPQVLCNDTPGIVSLCGSICEIQCKVAQR